MQTLQSNLLAPVNPFHCTIWNQANDSGEDELPDVMKLKALEHISCICHTTSLPTTNTVTASCTLEMQQLQVPKRSNEFCPNL